MKTFMKHLKRISLFLEYLFLLFAPLCKKKEKQLFLISYLIAENISRLYHCLLALRAPWLKMPRSLSSRFVWLMTPWQLTPNDLAKGFQVMLCFNWIWFEISLFLACRSDYFLKSRPKENSIIWEDYSKISGKCPGTFLAQTSH